MASSSSVPCPLDFVHYQGDTFRRTLAFSEDITGWVFEGHVRTDVADVATEPVAEFTFTEVTSKSVELSLSSLLTAMLSGRYVYDVQAQLPGSLVTLIAGKFVVTQEVTR